MGKLLQATRRMVNEAFGTNFGRVRNVEKAWEMAQEENAEHARRQTERKLASFYFLLHEQKSVSFLFYILLFHFLR